MQLHVGKNDPLSTAPVDAEWVTVGIVTPESMDIELPWDLVEQIVYPTNFVKEIDGRRANVYHPIHINRLRELHDITGLDAMAMWADRWAEWDELYPDLHARAFVGGNPDGSVPAC